MKDSFFADGIQYISAIRAAKKIGYANDYVGQLCRSGKISGKLIGKTWYVNFDSLAAYKNNKRVGRQNISIADDPSNNFDSGSHSSSRNLVQDAIDEIVPRKSESPLFTYQTDDRPRLPELSRIKEFKPTKRIPEVVMHRKEVRSSAVMAALALLFVMSLSIVALETHGGRDSSLSKGVERAALAVTYPLRIFTDNLNSDDFLAAGLLSKGVNNFFDGVARGVDVLRNLAFGKLFIANTEDGTNPAPPASGSATTTPSVANSIPSNQTSVAVTNNSNANYYDLRSLRNDLKNELESYIDTKIGTASAPVVIYSSTPASINTQTLDSFRDNQVVPITYNVVTRQSSSDVSHFSRTIDSLITGDTSFSRICIGTDCRTSWPAGGSGSGASVFADLGDVSTSSDATGDIYYLNASGQITNLGVGTTGQVLKVSGGLPSWGTDNGGSGTFAWTPTSWGVSTSTTLGFLNGFLSTASSTINSTLLVTSSTTLQNLTFVNATGTSATTTNFFSTTASSSNLYTASFNGAGLSSCNGASNALTWSGGLFGCNSISAGSSFAWTPTSWGVSTSTTLGFLNGFLSTASSTIDSTLLVTASTTIGGGTQGSGLTINGGATTTEDAYFGGSIGIGTSNPSRTIHITNSSNAGVRLENTGTGGRSYSFFSTDNTSGLGGGRFGVFDDTGSTARLVITSAGNVGLSESTPGSRLSVSGNATIGTSYDTLAAPTNGLLIQGSVGVATTSPYATLSIGAGTSGTVIAADAASGFSGGLLDLKVASTTVFYVDQSGSFIASGNSTTTNATTTNFFSTTASSSNLYTASFNGAGLSSCNGASNALTWSGGLFGCNSITGGSGDPFAWTPTSWGVSTSTTLGFLNGFLSTASSTINSSFHLPTLSSGGLGVDSTGLVYSGATTTAGTGLTYSGNAFNVNTSQNIATLSNLTSNGFVKTSGGNGTLSVDTTTYLSSYDAWTHPAAGKSATTSELQITGGLLSTASTTIDSNLLVTGNSTTTNATTTNFFSTTASSSNLYTASFNGAGLSSCNGASNALTWSGGLFGCNSITGGSGDPFAWTPTSWGVSTSTTLGFLNGFLSTASSTIDGNLIVTGNSTTTNATTTNFFSTTASSTNLFSSLLTVGNNALFVNSSGNIGIGTNNPQERVHVLGSGAQRIEIESTDSSAPVLKLTNTSGSYGFFAIIGQFRLFDYGANQYRFTVDSAGKFGLGTTSPYARLAVEHLSSTGTVIGADTLTNFSGSLLDLKVASSTKFSVNQSGDLLLTGSTTLQNFTFVNATGTAATTTNFFSTTASSTNLFSSLLNVGSNALIVDSSGNVGVKTANPTETLHVTGSILATADIQTNSLFQNNTTGAAQIYLNDSAGVAAKIQNDTSRTWSLAIGAGGAGTSLGTPILTWNDSRKVGIGTTTPFSILQIGSSTASTTFKPQIAISDFGAGTDKKHWTLSSQGGNFYIASSTDAYATSSLATLSINGTTGTTSVWALDVLATGANATSTIEGNLNVKGTLKVGTGSVYISETGIKTTAGSSFDLSSDSGSLSVSTTGFGTTTVTGLNVNGSATSTSNVGYNITTGCYATNDVCVGTGSSGSSFAWTPTSWGVSTSTTLGFLNGFLSTASSTIDSSFHLPTLSAGGLGVDSTGLVYSGATTTAGTGLTYSGNAFNVNTSQNIATLSNLTSNGFVKTSGGNGTLSVDTTTYLSSYDAWTHPAYGGQATSSLLTLTGGLLSTASTTIDSNLLVTGNSTTTNATTTNFFSTTASSSNLYTASFNGAGLSSCNGASNALTWSGGIFGCNSISAGSSFAWTPTTWGVSTSTTLGFLNGFLSTASSTIDSTLLVTGSTTLQNFTFVNATGTSATTTNFFSTTASSTNLFSSLLTVGSNALVVNSSGQIGAGTSTPQWLLNPYSSTESQLSLSAGAGIAQWAFRNAGGNLYLATTTVAGTATTSSAALTIIGSNGRVGVGTTSPYAKLSVYANAGETTDTLFAIGSSTASTISSLFSVSNTGLTTIGNSSGTGDANFQFAGDSNAWSMGYYSTDKTFRIASSTALSSNVMFQIGKSGTTTLNSGLGTGTGGNYLCIDTTTFEVLRGNGASCTASSQRFKENIEGLNYGLESVLSLRPVSYNYKEETNMGEGVQLGFIAEEINLVIPEVVTLDKEGKVYGLNYPVLTSVLTKAIQELNSNVEALAGLTASSTSESVALADTFWSNMFMRLTTWFADASNGIQDFFANRIRTKELCVRDDTGGETCINKAELDALIIGATGANTVTSPPPPAPPPTPTPSPTPSPTPGPNATSTPGSGTSTSTTPVNPSPNPSPTPLPPQSATTTAATSTSTTTVTPPPPAPAPAPTPVPPPAPAPTPTQSSSTSTPNNSQPAEVGGSDGP